MAKPRINQEKLISVMPEFLRLCAACKGTQRDLTRLMKGVGCNRGALHKALFNVLHDEHVIAKDRATGMYKLAPGIGLISSSTYKEYLNKAYSIAAAEAYKAARNSKQTEELKAQAVKEERESSPALPTINWTRSYSWVY